MGLGGYDAVTSRPQGLRKVPECPALHLAPGGGGGGHKGERGPGSSRLEVVSRANQTAFASSENPESRVAFCAREP